ncbi:hypothetical protein FACS189434_02190 [Bacteroidia bacterium]|nr:hypothetical protein FACS189434_02190 [Bacteroidia bacterium]
MNLSAQTVLTYATHGMQKGDVLTLTELANITAGDGGANQIWDYSAATLNGKTSTLDYQSTDGKTFAVLQNGDMTVNHSVSDKGKLYYGLQSENAIIEFDEPLTELAFPFRYQSQVAGDLKGTYTDLNSGKAEKIDGAYSVTADGYGTLILPNGVTLSKVLRVTYVKDYTQDLGNASYHITVKHYLYYAAESRYPVLQIKDAKTSCDCGCNHNELTAAYNANVTPQVAPKQRVEAPQNLVAELLYTVYPNPTDKELHIDYDILANAKVKISLLDFSGKKVKNVLNAKQELGAYSTAVNVENLPSGNYILELQVNDKVYTEKIIKK